VTQGSNFNFSFVANNAGNASAGHHYAGIAVDQQPDETHYVAWNDIASLAAGGQTTLTNFISTANLSVGQHTLYIKEDYWQNMVSESNETNNVRSVTFNVTAPNASVTLQPGPEGTDLWITNTFSYNDDYGVDDGQLKVGGWGDVYDSLIKFDLSTITATHVSSAQLKLYNLADLGVAPAAFSVEQLSTPWNESYGWYSYGGTRPENGGNPTAAPPGLSFTHVTDVAAPAAGWVTIDVTNAVNAWLANPATNSGLLLHPLENNNNFDDFVSSDATGATAQFRPELYLLLT